MSGSATNGQPLPVSHPLSFARADKEMYFNRIRPELRMPESHMHFPIGDLAAYSKTYDAIRCVVMQGGQGDVKHWAFNVHRNAKAAMDWRINYCRRLWSIVVAYVVRMFSDTEDFCNGKEAKDGFCI